jgi:glycosyltransferase involved in cell wall biosynthesis
MSDKMKISAVIPAYNCEAHIARAIDSVLNQTHPADEIIIVDDGSSDDTVQAVRSYGDKVTLIQQENAGASAARNTGIEAATGNWIAFLDADDEWLPDMLQRQTDILTQHPHLVWTTGNYKICFCQRGYGLTKTEPEKLQTLLRDQAHFNDYFDAFSHKVRGWTCCMVIRKDILQEVGLFCTALPKANDVDMWFRIAYHYPKIGFVAEPLAIYHVEAGDCISIRPMAFDYLDGFLRRHLELAESANRLEAFTPCARQMLRAWVRSALFDDRIYDIQKAICQFDSLLSKRYTYLVYVMTILPGLTKRLLQLLSWMSQTFKLRRQTWHPKKRYKKNNSRS